MYREKWLGSLVLVSPLPLFVIRPSLLCFGWWMSPCLSFAQDKWLAASRDEWNSHPLPMVRFDYWIIIIIILGVSLEPCRQNLCVVQFQDFSLTLQESRSNFFEEGRPWWKRARGKCRMMDDVVAWPNQCRFIFPIVFPSLFLNHVLTSHCFGK